MLLPIRKQPLFPLALLTISCSLWADQSTGSIGADAPIATFQASSPQACITLQENGERLKCYDSFFQPPADLTNNTAAKAQAVLEPTLTEQSPTIIDPLRAEQASAAPTVVADESWRNRLNPLQWVRAGTPYDPSVSLLDRRWELSKNAKLGTFHLKGYKPNYVLPVFITGNVNDLPTSPNPENQVNTVQDISKIEGKFQLSLKSKAWQGVFGDYGDLWIGYTQSSRWQIYNAEDSRPFRETNYEPEASLMFATNYNLLGLDGRLLGISLNHQSNGRSLPLSRSWNRAILNIGLERDNFALMLRPWYQIKEEKPEKDDNVDIKEYVGRGDIQAYYKYKQQEFSLMLRHTLKGGDRSRGAMQFDWAFPINGDLRGYVQVFDGYGESLIDYNHKATYVGLGVSLLNWY